MSSRLLNRRTVLAGAVCGVVIVAAGSAVVLTGQRGTAASAATTPTGTATVVRTDLSTTQQVNGTLGFAGTYTVVDLVGTTPSQRASEQIQLAQALAEVSAGDR